MTKNEDEDTLGITIMLEKRQLGKLPDGARLLKDRMSDDDGLSNEMPDETGL